MERQDYRGEGVSPIISVILLIVVAITLAAVVLSFTTGLADDLLQKPPQAGITMQEDYHDNGRDDPSYDLLVTVSSMPNADKVVVRGPVTESTLNDVGDHVKLTGLSRGEVVTVVAYKGNQQVVVRQYTIGS